MPKRTDGDCDPAHYSTKQLEKRKAPAFHANDCPGQTKVGLNGVQWISAQISSGRHRWKQVKTGKKASNEKTIKKKITKKTTKKKTTKKKTTKNKTVKKKSTKKKSNKKKSTKYIEAKQDWGAKILNMDYPGVKWHTDIITHNSSDAWLLVYQRIYDEGPKARKQFEAHPDLKKWIKFIKMTLFYND
jgi:hypothetical protein